MATRQQERHLESNHSTRPAAATANSNAQDPIVIDEDDEPDTTDGQSRAPRHSKSQNTAPCPKTLQYYPGSWKTVLERAKNRFVRHVFLNLAFPVRDDHLDIADSILHEEIVRGMAENLTLDNGELFYLFQHIFNCKYLAYCQTRDMNIVVSVLSIVISVLNWKFC